MREAGHSSACAGEESPVREAGHSSACLLASAESPVREAGHSSATFFIIKVFAAAGCRLICWAGLGWCELGWWEHHLDICSSSFIILNI